MTLPSMEEGMGADSALSRGGPCRAREGLGLLQEPLLLPAGQGRARLGPATRPVRGPRAWKEPVKGASQAKEAAKGRPPSVLPHHLPSVPPPPHQVWARKLLTAPWLLGGPRRYASSSFKVKGRIPRQRGWGLNGWVRGRRGLKVGFGDLRKVQGSKVKVGSNGLA